MGFFELLGVFVFLYYIINIILWIVLDSDIELAFKERFGQPISSLRGKVVWITGASSGIGKHLALSLAKYGVKLVISARREAELEDVKEQCLEISTGLLARDDILVLRMDMLEIDKHEQHFKRVLDHFNRIDILVNNAGRSQRAIWENIDLNVDRELFELDVFSVINLSRIAVKYFKQQKIAGHLAVTSSGAGLVPIPYSASYSGAKFALHGYFGSLKTQEPNLDVTVFCPGPIATNFLSECFTENVDEKHVPPSTAGQRKMSADRCGELFAVALANKCLLSWAALFPANLLIYVVLYFPSFAKIILKIMGARGLKKVREGK